MNVERDVTRAIRDSDPSRGDRRVAKLAAAQFGVVDVDELEACGVDKDGVARRVRDGRLHPLYKRVYAVGHPQVPVRGLLLAAVKACGPAAVISHFAAAVLWSLFKWDGRQPDVLVPGDRRPRGIRTHKTSRLDDVDVRRKHGIPVTSPARTLIDLAATLPPRALRRATREALAQGIVTIPQLTEALRRLAPCRGCTNLRRIVAKGHVPTRSELEDAVLDLIEAGGLDPPLVNAPLYVAGRRLTPDFRWPEKRLILEADGARYHDNDLARHDDAQEASGERVLRITWEQAIARPEQTLARVRGA